MLKQPQKTSTDVEDLSNNINQLELTDIYKILHSKTPEYTFFTSTHETFYKTDHMIDHKTNEPQ